LAFCTPKPSTKKQSLNTKYLNTGAKGKLGPERKAMTAKQVLLYRPGAKLTGPDIQALREAGIIPIKVEKFEDVKVIDPHTAHTRNDVWLSAMEAIARANNNEGPRTIFGRLLAERLANCAPAATETPKK
jgi:hypothetical protein